MVWLVNMADTDRPDRNSPNAAPPQPEAPDSELVSDCIFQAGRLDCVLTSVPLFTAVSSPTPSSLSQDDGGFTPSWVSQQEHQLGNLQSTEQTRREIQEMPSTRPPAEDDDEESEFTLNKLCCVFPRFFKSSNLHLVRIQPSQPQKRTLCLCLGVCT